MTWDFIVMGGGIAGASITYELARDAKVCLIEAETWPGYHATGRSAALFAPSYGGREIRALTRASRSFFDSPPPDFCDHPLLRQRGCLYIARTDQSDRLSRMIADISASGGQVSLIDQEQAISHVPLLRTGYVAQAATDSNAMDIDVNALHQGFWRKARSAGATLLTGQAPDNVIHRDGLWSVRLRDQEVSAPVLVNATGAWADEFAASCGVCPLGLQALLRTAVLVDAPDGINIGDWPAVIDVDEQFYFKPEAGKLLLSPADETPAAPGDAQPDELDIAVAVDRVEAALDIQVRRISRSWAGLRTFTPDRAPAVGFDPRAPGFFWCAGQGGYGIQTAPGLARTAAALARREKLPPEVAAQGLAAHDLSPQRFHPEHVLT